VAVYTDSNKVLVRALGRVRFSISPHGAAIGTGEYGAPDGRRPAVRTCRRRRGRDVGQAEAADLSEDVEWNEEGPGEGTRFGGRSKHLTHAAVGSDYHVGMLIEAPAPGRRLAPLHYHMGEEEHALILEGQVTLLLGDERYDMKAGDYVCFPAGRKVGHSFMNGGTSPCSYLMIGERNPNDVCVYPDSNKMAVNALRTRDGIFDLSGVRKYWDGEQTR